MAASLTHPLDLLRTQMSLRENDGVRTYTSLVRDLAKNQGTIGFFRGLVPNAMGIIIYKGFGFLFYENIYSLGFAHGVTSNKYVMEAVAAPLGSAIGQLVGYPFDVIKRNYMVANRKVSLREMTVIVIQRNGGIRGFFKGFTVNLIKTPIGNAIAFPARRFLNEMTHKQHAK